MIKAIATHLLFNLKKKRLSHHNARNFRTLDRSLNFNWWVTVCAIGQ